MQFDNTSVHNYIIDDKLLKQYIHYRAKSLGSVERDLATIVDKLSWAIGDIIAAYNERLKEELAKQNIHIDI